jgi:RNA polymerase sigma factor (sigma-70 family)
VRRLLRRLSGDHGLADDLAQETFLRAYRGLAALRAGGSLKAWLCRIAYHVFLSEHARRRDTPDPDIERSLPTAAIGERSTFRHDLSRALGKLEPRECAALALAYGQDATREEIAVMLDCPVPTVKTHILRAKAKLRRELGSWADLAWDKESP